MLTTIMKWITIAALLTAAMVWGSEALSQFPRFLLRFVIGFGAVVVAVQASRANRYMWAGIFAVIALAFNPLVPVLPSNAEWGRLMTIALIVPFAVSLTALRTQPRMSIPSITDRNPGSESL